MSHKGCSNVTLTPFNAYGPVNSFHERVRFCRDYLNCHERLCQGCDKRRHHRRRDCDDDDDDHHDDHHDRDHDRHDDEWCGRCDRSLFVN